MFKMFNKQYNFGVNQNFQKSGDYTGFTIAC